jgi:hypothetical protein
MDVCFSFSFDGVRMSPLGTLATNWPIVPASDDYYGRGAVGGMRNGRGNRSTRRKPAPVPLCPQQIPHDLTWARTRAAAVGSRRLTVRGVVRPWTHVNTNTMKYYKLRMLVNGIYELALVKFTKCLLAFVCS